MLCKLTIIQIANVKIPITNPDVVFELYCVQRSRPHKVSSSYLLIYTIKFLFRLVFQTTSSISKSIAVRIKPSTMHMYAKLFSFPFKIFIVHSSCEIIIYRYGLALIVCIYITPNHIHNLFQYKDSLDHTILKYIL